MKLRNVKTRILIYMMIFILVAIAIEGCILSFTNRKQVDRTADIILDEVEGILTDNEEEERSILASLKEEYVGMAKAVEYILRYNEAAKTSESQLRDIAKMLSIDEIHLFDEEGVLYSGTNPEYYGLTFDDGEQVSYFKPMLSDKKLSMCQDVTPNTAVAKSMMYAITWDRTGTYMVQVGVEPIRLIEEFKHNGIHEVVAQMTAYDGMNIYVAEASTGVILGATDSGAIGKTLYEQGFANQEEDLTSVSRKSTNIGGFTCYCNFRQYEEYVIAVVHSTQANVESFIIAILIVLVWLLIAGLVIVFALLKLANANKKISEQISLLSSISDIYYSMHLINLSDYSIETLEENERMRKVIKEGENASDMLERIVRENLEKEYIKLGSKFVDLSTLPERLMNRKSIAIDVVNKNVGWLRISFISVETDAENKPISVIIATQTIEEDKKREEELSIKAHRDELTGLFNRRAYENDLMIYPDIPAESDFVYVAIDINGLKVVNDELGHAAGDELIRGAAECMKRTLGNHGRVYRTGGDEFVSMLFSDKEHLELLLADLEDVSRNWSGEFVSGISLSVGYTTKREFADETVVEMSKIADQRMYKAKAEYYSHKGIDRKGQAAAHTALCKSYTKILKINLTEDNYSIVNMDTSEQTEEMGFSVKISEWLQGFGKTGQVHPDDLEVYLKKTDIEYLKKYFAEGMTSIGMTYRRKTGDEFKQFMMEMIPANDYSANNQSLFLYVKMIDR